MVEKIVSLMKSFWVQGKISDDVYFMIETSGKYNKDNLSKFLEELENILL